MTSPTPSPAVRVFRRLLRGALLAWAAFWAWFVLAVSLGEPPPPPWWIPAAWLVALGALVALVWRWPRAGGLALVAAAVASAFAFPTSGARALLSAPAFALGLGSCALGFGARRLAGAATAVLALLPLAIGLGGCHAPQDPADLPFRTSSILRHENGRMQRAFLVEETELAGYPCRRWVWWYEDGSLDNVELARDLEVQGHVMPAHTRIFLDRDGRLAHAWLSKDATIDGRPCRGGWKIDTAFHPNGRVKAFFPPDALEVDGVTCAASVFAPVYLHPDGSLRQCKLAADATIAGIAHRRGETVVLQAPAPEAGGG